jgi:hypothetical protein
MRHQPDGERSGGLGRGCQPSGAPDNLYIVDASVLPTSAAVNPSLTIAALALRAGDHRGDRCMTAPLALITGGQQGIGLGIARVLAAAGWRLALVSQAAPDDEAVVGAGGPRDAARHFRHDLADIGRGPCALRR